MFDRIINHPITSIGGLVILLVGASLLGLEKITWEQFLIFLALSGIGALIKDPSKT